MAGFVDLHCHWLPGVDDGVSSLDEAAALLAGLGALGFERIIATPHVRTGVFDNDPSALSAAFDSARLALGARGGLPALGLGAEHFLDDVVLERLLDGAGLPHEAGRAVLIELEPSGFSPHLERVIARLARAGWLPVLAHPERYRPLWREPERLEQLLDAGAVALLDVAAVVGKYGRQPAETAWALLELGLYRAACSDAHRAADVPAVERGMQRLAERYGAGELRRLLESGPRAILEGRAR